MARSKTEKQKEKKVVEYRGGNGKRWFDVFNAWNLFQPRCASTFVLPSPVTTSSASLLTNPLQPTRSISSRFRLKKLSNAVRSISSMFRLTNRSSSCLSIGESAIDLLRTNERQGDKGEARQQRGTRLTWQPTTRPRSRRRDTSSIRRRDEPACPARTDERVADGRPLGRPGRRAVSSQLERNGETRCVSEIFGSCAKARNHVEEARRGENERWKRKKEKRKSRLCGAMR